ncbi:helix-turn-helix domain-containing protein [Paenibacillus rhizoplanae]
MRFLTYLTRVRREAGMETFTIPFDREAMAEYLDVDRSALSRELAWMKRDGLIEFCRNEFRLLQQAAEKGFSLKESRAGVFAYVGLSLWGISPCI